ncbi:hypothetical protein CR513_04914, partial [Mucuna pruriens]
MDVFELLIYGIVLFLYIEDHVDLAAINAFLAKRNRGENPMIMILANTYYSLNCCYERNRKGLRCCTTLLYLWLATHLFHNNGRTTCPIEDYHWSWVTMMSKAKWTKHLDEATEKSIRWYPRWNERGDTIIRCGGFPNVPLMGTKGAINYNLELVPKQVSYPITLPPPEEAITPFIIHALGAQDRGKPGGVLSEKDPSGNPKVAVPHPITRPGFGKD